MKITCQSCQAKYTIADDKVLGKIVKIRCKKCAATIVVNGSDSSGAATYGAPEPTAGSDSAGADAGQDGTWTVNVADGDQRNMTDADIVSAYHNGVVGTETYCWKDGMSDWLPLREIDSLYDACTATRAVADNALAAEEAARNQARGGLGSNRPGEAREHAAAATGNGTSNGGAGLVAARRAGGRAPGADLFQGAAQAGGEEDVLTSAPAGIPEQYDEAQKPIIGARNENSVLFSLSALTSKGGDRPPPTVPGIEASGLIDIRQLSAQMGRQDDKKRSRVDDIMNLSSGGAFNAALSAPVLAPPSIDQYAPSASGGATGLSGAPGKSKALIFVALGAGALVIVAAVGATTLLMRKGTDTDGAASSASAAAVGPSALTTAAAPPASETAAAAPETTAAETAAAANGTAAAATATAAATAAAAPAAPPAAAPVAAAPAAPRPQAAAPAPTHAAPAAAAPEADQPFNMGEAKSRLAAAAAAAQSCKKPDGPVGTGRVVVVFGPSGGAQSATITGPPFEGTPTGACVGARFRGVRVPMFSGSPFSVSKSFTIN